MSLNGVSSELSSGGSPGIHLVKGEKVLEELRLMGANQEHRSFILSTWVKSYETQARKQGIKEFYSKHEPKLAEKLWDKCIVLTDDSGYTVHAWVCSINGALYHVYVVPELRKLRVATRLIEYAGPLKEYARPWPFAAHARVNPYLLGQSNA
jgi:GNAT superfamily N-acetyltransferase